MLVRNPRRPLLRLLMTAASHLCPSLPRLEVEREGSGIPEASCGGPQRLPRTGGPASVPNAHGLRAIATLALAASAWLAAEGPRAHALGMPLGLASEGQNANRPAASPRTSPAAPATTPPTDGLAEVPLEAELLGFRMRVPAGTAVRVERSPTTSYLLSEGAEEPTWRIRATALRASRAETTALSQCQAYLVDLEKRSQKYEVLASEARAIAGGDAHLLYLTIPLEQGGNGISGTLVVPQGPENYLVFSILALEADFAKTRALLDRAFATIALIDTTAASRERAELLGAGAALFTRITPESLRAAATRDALWYRMTRPDESGKAKDFGYMSVRVREGARGEVDASRDVRGLAGPDAEKGLLAIVNARVVVNDDPTHTMDVESRYFMTYDRASEAWSIRSTQRHKRAERSSAQTGVRAAPTAGAPRPLLRVITASKDGMTREPQEWPLPPVYLSQAELIVLGELLPRDENTPRVEFMDYAFDQRDEKLPQRRELWTRSDAGWRLETRIGSSPAPLVQEFDREGRRVRRIDPDGTVTELIDVAELRTLWKSKGLPVD